MFILGKRCKRCVSIALMIICFSFVLSNNSFADNDVTFTVNNNNTVLELNIPSSVDLRLTPTRGSAYNTANLNIGIGTNNSTGYSLSMTASSSDLTRTSSITDGNNNTSTPTIPTITGTFSPSDFESSNGTLNKWGYKKSTESNFKAMVASTSIPLKETAGPSNATGTDVVLNFAAKVDTTQPSGTYQTTLNFTAVTNMLPIVCNPSGTTISTIVCMQDVTTSNINSILSSMTPEQQYQLYDSRDEKQYYVSKLADGNIWMTQNLDFDIVNGGSNLDHTNTDVPTSWSDAGNLTNTYATGVTTWTGSTSAPESYDPGDLCWNGVLGDYNLSTGTTDCNASNKHYHIGNYYNWTAAVAMSDSSSYTVDGTDVDQSICPAGWMLPKGGPTQIGSGSFQYLVNQLSLTSGTSGNIQNSPVYFVYGGVWSGSSSRVGTIGFYWTSVLDIGDFPFSLYFDRGGDLRPQSGLRRIDGVSIRCVAR